MAVQRADGQIIGYDNVKIPDRYCAALRDRFEVISECEDERLPSEDISSEGAAQ